MSDAVVWGDPGRMGGSPCITGTRITTRTVAITAWRYGADTALDCWPHVTEEQVKGACWYEARHGARKWQRRWADWLASHEGDMWRGEWDRVPTPPSKEAEG